MMNGLGIVVVMIVVLVILLIAIGRLIFTEIRHPSLIRVKRKPLTAEQSAAFLAEMDAYSVMQDAIEDANNRNPPRMW